MPHEKFFSQREDREEPVEDLSNISSSILREVRNIYEENGDESSKGFVARIDIELQQRITNELVRIPSRINDSDSDIGPDESFHS